MKQLTKTVLAMILCASIAEYARAQVEPPVTLKVGDPAPALAGGKWVKGDAIDKFENGKIYVLEFWATWCGPCIQAIPHVSDMQASYEKDGVTFIGQNVWERDQTKVEPFVKEQGEKMKYRVRMDDVSGGTDGKMAKTWMEAAGQGGIPCSFVIGKDGKIAWIGHPMALEPILKQVIAGTFDPIKAQAEAEAAEKAMAAQQDEMQKAGQDLMAAMQGKDFDKALSILDDIQKKHPEMSGQLDFARFNVLLAKKDYDTAYKTATKLGESMKDNAMALNAIAWTIVDTEGLEKRDLDVAEKLATRAVEVTEHKNSAMLDTLARVHFEKGQIDKAIAVQTEAVSKAEDDDTKKQLGEALEKYKNAKK
jgi:thiol-disulfide isomerase/thioredoxin